MPALVWTAQSPRAEHGSSLRLMVVLVRVAMEQ
jgi:hypothetical protein